MPDNNLVKQLEVLSQYVYHDKNISLPKGYTKILTAPNSKNGFYAQAFYNGKDIVIAYRGTDINKNFKEKIKDIYNDASMGRHELPDQARDAINFYNKLRQEYPNKHFILTGHSLGGSLAQIVGAIKNVLTIPFSPYGTKNDKALAMKYYKNIYNYGDKGDLIYTHNMQNQIGNTYEFNHQFNLKTPFKYHKIENYGDLKGAVKYNATGFAANIDSDGNKIYTKEDLDKMSKDDLEKNHDKIMKQVQTSRGTKAA